MKYKDVAHSVMHKIKHTDVCIFLKWLFYQ